MADLQQIARAAVGKDRPGKDAEDWCNELWGVPASPGIRSAAKRKEREEEWVEKLARADGRGSLAKTRRLSVAAGDARPPNQDESENRGGTKSNTTIPSPPPSRPRALGLVTNVLADEGNAVERVKCSRADKHSCPPVILLKTPTADQGVTNVALSNARQAPLAANLSADSPLEPDKNLAPILTPKDTPAPPPRLHYASTPLGIFLSAAVVWLVRPTGTQRPAWRVPSSHIIPHGHQVHSLDALLIGCKCAWADRGVIFMEEDTGHVVERLKERWTEGKPVFVFGFGVLSYANVAKEGEIEKRAICRVG